MNGQWIPDGLWKMDPFWINLFENITTVQFMHRTIASVLVVLIITGWYNSRKYSLNQKTGFNLLLGMSVIQATLGLLTLLYGVPITIAVLHQAGSLVLLTFALYTNYQLSPAANNNNPINPLISIISYKI